MIKRMLAALGPALLLLANTGCRTCNCIDGEISYHFTGYTATELQVVMIKTYPAGSNFSILTDSTTYLDETISAWKDVATAFTSTLQVQA